MQRNVGLWTIIGTVIMLLSFWQIGAMIYRDTHYQQDRDRFSAECMPVMHMTEAQCWFLYDYLKK